jgi:hypothetical protein
MIHIIPLSVKSCFTVPGLYRKGGWGTKLCEAADDVTAFHYYINYFPNHHLKFWVKFFESKPKPVFSRSPPSSQRKGEAKA